MKCNKCSSTKLAVVTSGPHKKLVCNDCLVFIKFLSADEFKNFMALKNIDNSATTTLGPDFFSRIAEAMVAKGIKRENVTNNVTDKNFENWTHILVDVLEELYGVESRVRDAILNK